MSESPTDLAARLLAVPALRKILNSHASTDAPLPSGELLLPHTADRRYGASHYNVVIPDLPAPHRYLGCAVIIGGVGTRAFDIDHAVHGSPRNTATIALGTAATAPDGFCSYSIEDDCDLREDGSLLRFGDDLRIEGRFPDYRITVQRPDFTLDIEVAATDEITWFAAARSTTTSVFRRAIAAPSPTAASPPRSMACSRWNTHGCSVCLDCWVARSPRR